VATYFVRDLLQFRFDQGSLLGRRIGVERLLQVLAPLTQPLVAIHHSGHANRLRRARVTTTRRQE
jgi:hypothetical protein